jgi:hypothetical protein
MPLRGGSLEAGGALGLFGGEFQEEMLNDLGWLLRLDRVSRIPGGFITAGAPGTATTRAVGDAALACSRGKQ